MVCLFKQKKWGRGWGGGAAFLPRVRGEGMDNLWWLERYVYVNYCQQLCAVPFTHARTHTWREL